MIDSEIRGMKTRDHAVDNIRAFLIVCVVFAHLLEICAPFPGSRLLYKLIYTFHMPAFIFLFGYNARFSKERIIWRWCVPYAVFQGLYTVFARRVLHEDVSLQYTTPYWLLWYMLICIFYQLLLPVYDTEDKRKQLFTLAAVFVISLLAGFDDTVGYHMSLSRFLVFQPWFVLGYYCKKNSIPEKIYASSKFRIAALLIPAAGIALSVWFMNSVSVPNGLLYGSYSYAGCGAGVWLRVTVSLMALCWVVLLFAGVRPFVGRRLKIITGAGRYTWPVFLLHGFLVKLIPLYRPELLDSAWGVILTTIAMVLLLGNAAADKAAYYISLSWLGKYTGKC